VVIRLRRATAADVATLEHWDTQPHVIAATGADDGADWADEIATAEAVDWQEILIAEHDRRPLGVVQVIDPERERTHYWGDCEPELRAIDIWIGEAADLGRGHGTVMMEQALARCFAPPEVRAVLIDPLESNGDAQRFYRRLGFVAVGPRRFGADDCLVMRLDRERWDATRRGGQPASE
jgi:aminoglycoside 6'-N-acetyltransferase